MNKAEIEAERKGIQVTDKRGSSPDPFREYNESTAEGNVIIATDQVPVGSIAPLRKEDPLQKLLKNTLDFLFAQPEWFYIIGLPRPARRKMEREIAKLMTTIPSPRKVAERDKEPASESNS